MLLIKQKSDILGTFASSLCLIHCIATPFLFLAQASAATFHSGPPVWWKSLDYVFLAISFLAIFLSTKNTTVKNVVRNVLMPYHRHRYENCGFWYTNYNCLNFFDNSDKIPTGSCLV